MPVKAGEYLSNGLPVICTDYEEINKPRLSIICADNVKATEKSILRYYSNKLIQNDIRSKVYGITKINSWEMKVEELNKIMSTI